MACQSVDGRCAGSVASKMMRRNMSLLATLLVALAVASVGGQNNTDPNGKPIPGVKTFDFNGRRFKFVNSPTTRNTARTRCLAEPFGMVLASIRSQAEENRIFSELGFCNPFWIGLTRNNAATAPWIYSDTDTPHVGTEAYRGWAAGEPSDQQVTVNGAQTLERFAVVMGKGCAAGSNWNNEITQKTFPYMCVRRLCSPRTDALLFNGANLGAVQMSTRNVHDAYSACCDLCDKDRRCRTFQVWEEGLPASKSLARTVPGRFSNKSASVSTLSPPVWCELYSTTETRTCTTDEIANEDRCKARPFGWGSVDPATRASPIPTPAPGSTYLPVCAARFNGNNRHQIFRAEGHLSTFVNSAFAGEQCCHDCANYPGCVAYHYFEEPAAAKARRAAKVAGKSFTPICQEDCTVTCELFLAGRHGRAGRCDWATDQANEFCDGYMRDPVCGRDAISTNPVCPNVGSGTIIAS